MLKLNITNLKGGRLNFIDNKSSLTSFRLVMLLIVIILISVFFLSDKKSSYDIERTFRYSFTLQNKTNKVLKDVDFWVYAPVKETSNQKTDKITASHQYELTEDELGNQVLHFNLPQFAPFASKIIKIETKLQLSAEPVNQDINDQLVFLQAEKYVEVENLQIKTLAKQFETSDKLENARNTMNWVHQNIKYAGYTEQDRGAFYALKTRKGDCTEYMYLYTALIRSQGIPVRNMGGYIYGESKVLKPEDFHNWSEIYINGKWQVVDPQNGKFLEKQNNYIAFRVISNKISKKLTPTNTQRVAISNKNILIKMN